VTEHLVDICLFLFYCDGDGVGNVGVVSNLDTMEATEMETLERSGMDGWTKDGQAPSHRIVPHRIVSEHQVVDVQDAFIYVLVCIISYVQFITVGRIACACMACMHIWVGGFRLSMYDIGAGYIGGIHVS
jgi:hypothetical protein